MKPYKLEHSIKLFTVTASSFPEGIGDAYQKLHSFDPDNESRRCFGLSKPNKKGELIYKAAAEELNEGETEKFNCESFIIEAGNYITLDVHNYMDDMQKIGDAFHTLLKHPDIDPDAHCIEWFQDRVDLICMVKLKD